MKSIFILSPLGDLQGLSHFKAQWILAYLAI
jgi:hypothetical protein